MSRANTLPMKRIRSVARANQKHAAAKRIHHAGVIIQKWVVKIHRYLAGCGLPHSKTVAAVYINDRSTKRKEEEFNAEFGTKTVTGRTPSTPRPQGLWSKLWGLAK